MGFKVIETDEELEAALAAGLLWINVSKEYPRPDDLWYRPTEIGYAPTAVRSVWKSRSGGAIGYMAEDFAVLVEDGGEGDSPTTAREE